jgi:hypothetical protein
MYTGLENYYGEVVFVQKDNKKYYMRLGDMEGYSFIEIPESIFALLDDYFEKNKPEVIYE